MPRRTTLAIASFAVAIATLSSPVSAQEAGTFDAWGHTYAIPGSGLSNSAIPTARNVVDQTTGSIAPKRTYVSASADVRPAPTTRTPGTINVWGARFAAPAN